MLVGSLVHRLRRAPTARRHTLSGGSPLAWVGSQPTVAVAVAVTVAVFVAASESASESAGIGYIPPS